ncbi:MAG: GIY-YIG nuclease family protein, partial [Mizugakiibacter sp.]|uniref:GIY-YIG nuclease family protein n=1 Tax=Mizugakiibacter sp. TaxID=1972610 RepID=UPI00320D7F49
FERIRADAAAGILGVEVRTVQALAARGEVPGAAKIGGLWTFDESALRSFRLELDELKAQAKARAEPLPREDLVYVIRCDYKVKIGYTRNLAQRLHSLRTANPRPIALIVSFPGTRSDEKRLHQKFGDLRFSGEWFRLQKPIKEWLRDEHGVFEI